MHCSFPGMSKMKPGTILDYALFQLSPKRTRCELFVSSDGSTEKLASGLFKPFVAHLKIAEEKVASAAQSVRLEVGRNKNSEAWFTKGTLERFVRFVSTPEVLELVNTFDAEMSQLEAARRIYSQGAGDQLSGGVGYGAAAAEDATKKELLRAIDVRLAAVQQDLSTACARAAAAGFNIDTVSELQMFADRFGAHRLNEACSKLISLCERRPDLMSQWRSVSDDRLIRSSYGSDMSIDVDNSPPAPPSYQEQPATWQQPNPIPSLSINRTSSRESSVDGEVVERKEESLSTCDQTSDPSIPMSQPTRRLSVQDRINMFENKQKETSGGKLAVGKSVELRRMSSDVSSGSTLLRRWSGASDMSIDLSTEKKDDESPLCTPQIASVSLSKTSDEKKAVNSNEKVVASKSSKPEIKVIPSLGRVGAVSESKGGNFNKLESDSNLGSVASDGLKDQISNMTQSRSYISRDENQEDLEEKFSSSHDGHSEGVLWSGDEAKLKGSQKSEELIDNIEGMTSLAEVAGVKDSASVIRFKPFGNKVVEPAKILNQMEDSEIRDQPVRQLRSKATKRTPGEPGLSEVGAGSKIREAFAAHYKGIGGDSLSAHLEVKAVREIEGVEKIEGRSSEKLSSSSAPSAEDSGSQRMKFRKQNSAAEQSKTLQVQRDESSFSGIRGPLFSEENLDSFKTPPPEQTEKIKQSKGNQELNDELKMKANELEKLFAEHKLRVPGDQTNSTSRSRQADMQHEPTTSLYHSTLAIDIGPQVSINYQATEPIGSSKNAASLNATSLTNTIDNQNHGDTLNKKFSKLSVSDGSRGKLYDRYTQKRDAKLREDWSTNRAEKEARLKSMQDSFERNKSELKVKFLGSEDRQDSVSTARRRAERLRSFNSRAIMKRKQQHLDFGDFENEEALNFLERNDEDGALEDTSFVDGVSGSVQAKKLLPNNRSLSSSTTRASAASVSRSTTKATSMNSRRRRMQPENPLVQSVPNFSDLRKENTKPSPGTSKLTRSQVRSNDHSKNTSEEAAVVKQDKSHRSDDEILKNVATKPFLKKGSRAGFVARPIIAKHKVSVGSEQINNEEENNDLASGPDDFENTIKEGEEFEILNAEGDKTLENEEARVRRETEKYFDSGSENGENAMTFSQLDQALGSQLPTVPSSFHPVESMQDWPEESPMSWKLHIQNSFSYAQDMSDVDASMDSPVGSPASWNSQSLSQVEADAARMRKKWGTAQKPMLAANSSNSLSRKDMTRGLKRFLKFGRRNRGSESLVDWISATTSEGDDDTEDGRDPSFRSSEDLRKSRMGFSQAHPSDDGFNESEFFNEQVQSSQSSIPAPPSNFKLTEDHMTGSSIKAPKSSFFSLSSFRSKGSETKPR